MSMRPSNSDELVLMAQVARRHYIRRQTKTEIAADLGLSRFRVARLIDAAHDHGLVRIEVGIPGDVDLGLSAELREQFGLAHCIVLDTAEETEAAHRHAIGVTTTELLSELVTARDVLGISSTRALMGLTEEVPRLARIPVVQITGALSRPDASDVIEAVRRFTRSGGGPAYVFYAPLICNDRSTRDGFLRQPDVARCRDRYPDLTITVTGIGAWRPGLSTVHDAVPAADAQQCRDLGVTAEVAGILVDGDGAAVPSPLSERTVCMSEDELRAVPSRIGVAFDAGKADAVWTALSSGLINGLVTHRSLAEAVLNRDW